MNSAPRHLRIFLSSPGDVGDERALALKVAENLPYDPLLFGKVTFEVVAWDKKGIDTPFLATMTPQEAINQNLPNPSDCHIVIVIFWARMGTPLPFPEYQKDNGEQYLSGTEWEYEDALCAARESGEFPQIIVYRRMQAPPFTVTDADFAQKQKQFERVQRFFADFTNPDGSIQQSYNHYNTPDEFREKLENHLKFIIKRLLVDASTLDDEKPELKPPLWEGSPFPGLRPFTPADASIFFGRGRELDALIQKINTSPVVAVFGASGAGKSSLVAAGLIPRLKANAIEGSKDWLLPSIQAIDGEDRWFGLRMTPAAVEDNPFLALATQLLPMLTDTSITTEQLAQELETHPEQLGNHLLAILEDKPSWAAALLFIDQFEELFTRVSAQYRQPFVQMLEQAATTRRIRIVITVRADFFERMMNEHPLPDLLENSTQPLATPGPVALYEMIRKPADRSGLRFDDGLIEQILEDTGQQPGTLALLAYALEELYRSRNAEGHITFETYDKIGGVQGAIARRAEAVFKKLPLAAQKALPSLFRKLVDINAEGLITRRVVFEADLDNKQQKLLADALVDARLLYRDRNEKKKTVINVAHEALFINWERLAHLLDGEIDFYRWRRRLRIDAGQWLNEPDSSLLYLGNKLARAESYLTQYPDEIEDEYKDFIRASQRRRLRNRVIQYGLLAIPIVISLITIGNLLQQFQLRQTAITLGDTVAFPAATVPLGPDDELTFVDEFRIDRYEISYEQYRLCVRAGACDVPIEPPRTLAEDTVNQTRFQDADGQLPVVYTSAYHAADYCNWVGRRLPTMQEWERAVRGFQGRTLEAWVRTELDDMSRFNIGKGFEILSVGYDASDNTVSTSTLSSSLVHMIGNAAEWTASYCRGDVYEDCSGVWDGQSLPSANLRVMGFSHNDGIQYVENPALILTDIYSIDPAPSTIFSKNFGFRCVESGD